MAALNVLPADTVTRVSEYVPEIVRFVEKIEERGFAYSDGAGSIYFDVAAFDGRKVHEDGTQEDWEHTYAKLAPWSKGNSRLIDEGEGEHILLSSRSRGLYHSLLNSVSPSLRRRRFSNFLRLRQAFAVRFRSLEVFEGWRALLVLSLGTGTTWLAHRVLGYGQRGSRTAYRYPFWRNRLDLPSSRQRDGSERGELSYVFPSLLHGLADSGFLSNRPTTTASNGSTTSSTLVIFTSRVSRCRSPSRTSSPSRFGCSVSSLKFPICCSLN